jgi:hypothetical protein
MLQVGTILGLVAIFIVMHFAGGQVNRFVFGGRAFRLSRPAIRALALLSPVLLLCLAIAALASEYLIQSTALSHSTELAFAALSFADGLVLRNIRRSRIAA